MKRKCLALREIHRRKFSNTSTQKQLSHNWVCQFRASLRHFTITFMMETLTVVPLCFALSTLAAVSTDTVTSPGSRWVVTAACTN